jgi:hypothetical protein
VPINIIAGGGKPYGQRTANPLRGPGYQNGCHELFLKTKHKEENAMTPSSLA